MDLNNSIFIKFKKIYWKNKIQSGITLIELLIVFSIIGIIYLTIALNFDALQSEKDFKNKFKLSLENIKSQAITMNKVLALVMFENDYGLRLLFMEDGEFIEYPAFEKYLVKLPNDTKLRIAKKKDNILTNEYEAVIFLPNSYADEALFIFDDGKKQFNINLEKDE